MLRLANHQTNFRKWSPTTPSSYSSISMKKLINSNSVQNSHSFEFTEKPTVWTIKNNLFSFHCPSKLHFIPLQIFRNYSTSRILCEKSENASSTSGSPQENTELPPRDTALSIWLLFCAGVVFAMVSLGGLTRLTESGLSMVDWSLLHYKPPQSLQEWMAYFDQYKASPEYLLLNQGMSLEEFKSIYYMEYAHRMLGRFIGAVYFIPMCYFLLTRRKQLSFKQKSSLVSIAILILAQVMIA